MPPKKKKKIELAPPSTPATPATKHKNYIIHIEIQNIQNPRVTRTLSVPPSCTFHNLHRAIQIAFGWASHHHYHFEVKNIPGIWLEKNDPPPRTGPRVLLTIGNPELLTYLENEDKDGKVADEMTTKLSDVFENEKYKNKCIDYTYDMGDSWEHSVLLFGRAEEAASSDSIFCIGGEGAPVAEDVGGPPGWEHLKDVVKRYQRKGKLNAEDKHLIQWFKDQRNGGVEVWDWDLHAVNQKLSALRL
jgi:Plasmid pRiA4b ORF-3-like protein